jgi:hypothetical protein
MWESGLDRGLTGMASLQLALIRVLERNTRVNGRMGSRVGQEQNNIEIREMFS